MRMIMPILLVLFQIVAGDSVSDDLPTVYPLPNKDQQLPGFQDDIDGDDVFVSTKYGPLRGRRRRGIPDAGGESSVVDWFIGVPYASPPTGPLRFKITRKPGTWSATRDALRFSSICPQDSRAARGYLETTTQDEDCLYLNIYSPVPEAAENRSLTHLFPVMVYIHGGSYRVGSGNVYYGGHVLAQYGVVVVTLNYRLGVLGFLSARDADLPGNYGLHDQIAALKWIRDCIREFRGDPDRVTIFGNSAGGASVGILSVSPKAKGLFQNAIVQSGSPLALWAVHDNNIDLDGHARGLAELLNCKRSRIADIVSCLSTVPWTNILRALDNMPRISISGTDFCPVPDGTLLPDMPRKLFTSGQVYVRSLMTGIVESEMTKHMHMFLYDLDERDVDFNFNDGMERDSFLTIVRHVTAVKFNFDEAIADIVVHRYTNWSHDITDPYENRKQYVDFLTDVSMWAPTVELATHVARASHPTFLYTMKLGGQGDATMMNDEGLGWDRNHHQLELQYVFGSPFTGADVDNIQLRASYTAEDRNISRLMMTLWSNFAKTGNPSRSSDKGQEFVNWTEFHPKTSQYLQIISNDATIQSHYRTDSVTFWNDLVGQLTDRLTRRKSTSVPATGDRPTGDRQPWALVTMILSVIQISILIGLTILLMRRRKFGR